MSEPAAELRARLLALFRDEADEHVAILAAGLTTLESGSPDDRLRAVDEGLRVAHTLKGAARAVGLDGVESRCQALEALLVDAKRDEAPPAGALDRLRRAVADIARMVAGMEAGGAAAGARDDEGMRTPRLPAERLERVLVGVEALTATKLAAEERAREAAVLVEELTRLGVPRECGQVARQLLRGLRQDHRSVARTVTDLEGEMRRLRLTPAGIVLGLFPPMVRELAADLGKAIECVVEGEDLAVDRRVLDVLKDALIHLARNVADHAIEPPDVRRRRGKPATGCLRVAVTPREGRRVAFTVEDDGAGIDTARVRDAAVRANVLTPEQASALPDEAVVELAYRSRVTTSSTVTALSGRGVGLAIVRERVERLGGEIHTATRAGQGTTVTIVVPASIATFHGVLVTAAHQPFLVPQDAVAQLVAVSAGGPRMLDGRQVMSWREQALPLVSLAALLELPVAEPPAGAPPCVVVSTGEGSAAVLVDAVLGEREVLVKELRRPLLRLRYVAGAGLLGTGELALILRPADVVRGARGHRPRPAPPAPPAPGGGRRPTVLVADDSITTRTMERHLLEAAGYDVRVAVDGIDAWTALRTEPVDAVVSDVDMPRMDGFELTVRIRQDPALRDLPVVLVTALESPEHRERGAAVGANAYIVKSRFEQGDLLETLERLL